jgi:hypothetical protein
VTDTRQGGKGRPTPKRSQAQAARKKPLVTPRGAGRSSATTAEARRAMRQALRDGDERNYPPMAAGPERAAVRDVVDARRPLWPVALGVWLFGVVFSLVPSDLAKSLGTVTLLLVGFLLVADVVIVRRRVTAALAEQFPNGTKESLKTLGWYGTARNMQRRRSRLPRPRVEASGF